jgi:hypothetical protein
MKDFLASIVDYAGLFPPAELGMADAVRDYARVRSGPDRWMLGRFVVPAARLDEFRTAGGDADWELSVLVDRKLDVPGARAYETKAASEAEIWASDVPVFFEIAATATALLPAIRRAGGRAKIRTGGVPSSVELAGFLRACAAEGVAFKATAGLHHPVRHAAGHGFLNVFLAAALARGGAPEPELVRLLEETSPAAFRFDAAGGWRGMSRDTLIESRRRFALSFGSCSFQEPLDHLRELGFL